MHPGKSRHLPFAKTLLHACQPAKQVFQCLIHETVTLLALCVVLQLVKAQIVLWTAGFVLLTLTVNASLLNWWLRILKLSVGKDFDLAAAGAACYWQALRDLALGKSLVSV